MEITSDNFEERLPVIEKAITEADFLSFDCEFTGLGKGNTSVGPYDTPELIYGKFRQNVGKFVLMQFGLCAFKFIKEENRYEYSCFTCYVYPRVPKKFESMRVTGSMASGSACSFQPDSFEMLSSHGFDFNKWICKGVGYLRQQDIDRYKEELTRIHKIREEANESPQMVKVPDGMKVLVTKILKTVDEFMTEDENKKDFLEVPDLAAYERRIVAQSLESKYGWKVYVETLPVGRQQNCPLRAYKCAEKEVNSAHRQRHLDNEVKDIENAKGFCRILEMITKSGKPIIGHNMLMDLLHTCKAFCFDLPVHYADFLSSLKAHLPTVVDTKSFCALPQLRAVSGTNPSLGDLWKKVNSSPFPEVDYRPTEKAFEVSGSFHDAGYDAYITGVVFLKLAVYLGRTSTPYKTSSEIFWSLFETTVNKLAIPRVQDISGLDLSVKGCQAPDRSHVFHVSLDETVHWTNKDVLNLFSPFGDVHINWCNDSNLFVSLERRKEAAKVREKLCGPNDHVWKVRPVEEFTKELEKAMKEAEVDSKAGGNKRARPDTTAEQAKKTKAKVSGD
uniref:Poly(A)-specific ribonuclease RNA-binding domain-containing protein n=1 Tax=Plectus sambesii TaxID=2011161 RepID=A0A914X7Y0_9BILA